MHADLEISVRVSRTRGPTLPRTGTPPRGLGRAPFRTGSVAVAFLLGSPGTLLGQLDDLTVSSVVNIVGQTTPDPRVSSDLTASLDVFLERALNPDWSVHASGEGREST